MKLFFSVYGKKNRISAIFVIKFIIIPDKTIILIYQILDVLWKLMIEFNSCKYFKAYILCRKIEKKENETLK